MIRKTLIGAGLLLAADGWNGGVQAQSDYTIEQLLAPCVEADTDARYAETECEQYISGFTDAWVLLRKGIARTVCLPEQNLPDEVRWAFTKWAMQNYRERRRPAAEGLRATLETAFPCP